MPTPVTKHIWTMTKDARTLRCDLRDHPLGRELVLMQDGELRRGEVLRTQSELLRMQDEWRLAAESKGWRVR